MKVGHRRTTSQTLPLQRQSKSCRLLLRNNEQSQQVQKLLSESNRKVKTKVTQIENINQNEIKNNKYDNFKFGKNGSLSSEKIIYQQNQDLLISIPQEITYRDSQINYKFNKDKRLIKRCDVISEGDRTIPRKRTSKTSKKTNSGTRCSRKRKSQHQSPGFPASRKFKLLMTFLTSFQDKKRCIF